VARTAHQGGLGASAIDRARIRLPLSDPGSEDRTHWPSVRKGSAFRLAGSVDGPALKRMARDHPVNGWVSLSYEREPDYFAAGDIEGDHHRTFIAANRTDDEINGVFSLSVRERYVGGTPRRVCYLGQLRVRSGYAGKSLLIRDGFEICREALREARVEPYFLTTIVADNTRALRILTSGRCGIPTYRPLGSIAVLALSCHGRRAGGNRDALTVRSATLADLGDIVVQLRRQGKRFDFSPLWAHGALLCPVRTRGLSVGDFLIARSAGRIVGCAAIWDQRGIKQNVVRGYRSPVGLARPMLNALAPITGLPRLPRCGEKLDTAFISHFAVDDDAEEAAAALIDAALTVGRQRGLSALIVGVDVSDPRYRLLKRRYRPVEYLSNVYAAHWPDGAATAGQLGVHPLSPEIAVL
jgi:hypothetical protein